VRQQIVCLRPRPQRPKTAKIAPGIAMLVSGVKPTSDRSASIFAATERLQQPAEKSADQVFSASRLAASTEISRAMFSALRRAAK